MQKKTYAEPKVKILVFGEGKAEIACNGDVEIEQYDSGPIETSGEGL